MCFNYVFGQYLNLLKIEGLCCYYITFLLATLSVHEHFQKMCCFCSQQVQKITWDVVF
jgi:hypothetical protein